MGSTDWRTSFGTRWNASKTAGGTVGGRIWAAGEAHERLALRRKLDDYAMT